MKKEVRHFANDDHYLPRWVRELIGFCVSFTLIGMILIITLIGWI